MLNGDVSVARYDDARAAAAVRDALLAGTEPPECELVDLLNAAWAARWSLEERGRADLVTQLASTCANIALRGGNRA